MFGKNFLLFHFSGLSTAQSCKVFNYDYEKFSHLTYDKALEHITVSCALMERPFIMLTILGGGGFRTV